MIRRLLQFSILALIAVVTLLVLGDRIIRRHVPGTRLVYQIQSNSQVSRPDIGVEVADALRRRIDPDGIAQVSFHGLEGARLEVLVPDSQDVGDLKRMLRDNGVLEFEILAEDRNENGVAEMLARMQAGGSGPKPQEGDTFRWLHVDSSENLGGIQASHEGRQYVLAYATPIRAMLHDGPTSDWRVVVAHPYRDPSGGAAAGYAVAFELDERGGKLLGDLTEINIGQPLAIVLNGTVLSTPMIRSRIGRNGMINGPPGGFSEHDANYLAAMLNAGTLPGTLGDEPMTQEPATITLGMPPLLRSMLKIYAGVLILGILLLGIVRLLHGVGRVRTSATPTAEPYSRSEETDRSGSS